MIQAILASSLTQNRSKMLPGVSYMAPRRPRWRADGSRRSPRQPLWLPFWVQDGPQQAQMGLDTFPRQLRWRKTYMCQNHTKPLVFQCFSGFWLPETIRKSQDDSQNNHKAPPRRTQKLVQVLNPFLSWEILKTTPKMESKIMYFVAGGHEGH